MSAAVARRYYLRGRELLKQGQEAQAIDAFAAAVDLSATFVEARLSLAILVAKAEPRRAATLLRAGVAHRAPDALRCQVQGTLGDVLLMLGDIPGAEAAFKEAAALGAASRTADRRARVHAKTGDLRASFAALLEAAKS